MNSHKSNLLSSTMIQLFVGAGVAAGGFALSGASFARGSDGLANPPALAKPADGTIQLAACKARNPCAAKKACGACNPCAAKKACGACNPCAAKKACGACNPCAAKKACGACNPCAAKKACGACNPCSAKKACGACNPCAAKKACGACNPCAAKKACGACNPCAARSACGACNPCNPCGGGATYSSKCVIPRLVTAAACNPCAAKKSCGACNPCAAKKACGACNPCAAKKACGACNPCGGGGAPELTTAEAKGAYECLMKEMLAGYAKSGLKMAGFYKDWDIYNNQPYVSDTHGGRFVNNYANATAKKYGKFEGSGKMPVSSVLAKDSFAVHANGKMGAGPLFLMEKMPTGFNKGSGNWRYTMVMPDGAIFGVTNGENSAKMQFCIDCHAAVAEDQDSMMLLPDEYRAKSN